MLERTFKILLVEDNPGDARLIREMLRDSGGKFELESVHRLADGMARLAQGQIDLVLLDLGLPDSQGIETFLRAFAHSPQVPFVVLTGLADETLAVTAVQSGAQDYLVKGEVDGTALLRAIRYATGRKQVEEALRQSEENYRLLVNQVPAVVFKGYADWSLDCFDDKIEALTGYSKEDFDSRRVKWHDVILPEDLEEARPVFVEALESGRSYVREHRIHRKDGEVRWVQIRGQGLVDAEGRVTHINGLTFDITDRKRAEAELQKAHDELEARVKARTADLVRAVERLQKEIERRRQTEATLQASEAQHRTVFENTGTATTIVDADLTISLVNTEFSQISGYAPEEIQGRMKWPEFVIDDELTGTADSARGVDLGMALRSYEAKFRDRFGNVRDIILTVSLIPGTTQHITALLDISARKRAEGALKQAHDELEQRVVERTAELQQANIDLEEEVEERRKTEEELEAERRRLFSLLDGLPAYVYLKAPDFSIRFANRRFREIFGEPDNRPCYQVVAGRNEPCDDCPTQRVFRTKKPYDVERPSFGRTYQVYNYPFPDEDGSPLVLTLGMDITARKRVEEDLRRSEARLAEAQRIARLGNWEWNIKTNEVTWSEESFRIFGLSPRNFTPKYDAVIEHIHPDDRQRVAQSLVGAMKDGPAYDMDHRIVWPDGTVRILRAQAEVFFDSDFRPARMLGTIQDVTAAREAEAAIMAARARLEFLLTSSPAAIYSCKTDGDFDATFVSDNISEIVGYEAQECLASNFWASHLHPEDAGEVFGKLAGIGDRGSVGLEYRFRHRDGSYRWVRDDARLVRDMDGKPVEIVGSWVDITKRKEMEEALKESEQHLRYLTTQLLSAQEGERKRLSRELHDELGQSLLVMKMRLRAMEENHEPENGEGLKEGCRELLTFIDEVIENVRRLSRDLSPSILEDLGLSAALRHLFREFTQHHNIDQCCVEMDEIDGLFSQEACINIYRIFQEALTNIGKHARADRVAVAAKREAGKVSFMVEDKGQGFNLSETLGSDPSGRGLGLAAMEERVRMLGGALKLLSREGEGTRISFTVPVNG